MKIFSVSLFIIMGFAANAQSKDSTAIVKLLKSDYTTMGNWDIKTHINNCTADYLLIEEGEVWNLEKEKQYYQSNAGRVLQRKDVFTFKKIRISGDMAYAVYFLKSEMTEKGVLTVKTWNESAVFRKVGGQWKIALIHSTPSK
jgi:ketosteroid isomerase-like protein